MPDAIIVGAGPNGLTAAARLATAGWAVRVIEAGPTVGGGCRTHPLTTGSIFDHCATVHPFGASSPAFEALALTELGLRWAHPPIPLVHPLDDAHAAALHTDAAVTAAALGTDGPRWRRLVSSLADRWPALRHCVLAPPAAALRDHPVHMARLGLPGALPAGVLGRLFHTPQARALIAGMAAHSGMPLSAPLTGGIALALLAASQSAGMPFAAGGSQAIVDTLATVVTTAGGEIVLDQRVSSLDDLPRARAVLLDLNVDQLAQLTGRARPARRQGVGTCKLDLLLSAPMPWTAPACHQAGTIHLGGHARTIAAGERQTWRGQSPPAPFVVVTQPNVADPGRAAADHHILWAYRHVPLGAPGGVEGIEAQFDHFAPGWRDLVVHRLVTTAPDFATANANFAGGDIAGGPLDVWRLLGHARRDPYRTRIPGIWLCGQSTPPGPGVHGMCGWHAAGSVLRAERTYPSRGSPSAGSPSAGARPGVNEPGQT